MTAILLLINALVAFGLIILILLQRSDSNAGGAFGGMGGGGQPIIRNPLAKPTAILAAIFLSSSLLIAYGQREHGHAESVMQGVEAHGAAEVPAAVPDLPAPVLATSASAVVTTTLEVSPSK